MIVLSRQAFYLLNGYAQSTQIIFKGHRALEVSQNLADTFIKVMIISNLLMVLILKL